MIRKFFDWFTTTEARFSFMLGSFMIFFVLQPLIEEWELAGFLFTLIYTFILASAIYVCTKRNKAFWLILFSAITALVFAWLGDIFHVRIFGIFAYIYSISTLAFASFVILRYIGAASAINFDTIAGALCVYLLLGFLGGEVFTLIEYVAPDSFSFAVHHEPGEAVARISGSQKQQALIYYSYTTLTTVGYGDIVPVSSYARNASTLLAIVGQFYIMVVMAILVGVFVTDHISKRRSKHGQQQE